MPVIIGGVSAGAGLIQGLIGSGKARKAQRELENLKTPTTTSDTAISDYYDQARNPYNSLEYQLANQSTGQNLATGLSAAQDRRGGLAAIGGLVRQRNNALLGAAANAQSRLGQATQMKAADNERVFNINKMLPYQKQYSILAAKAGGANQLANAGFSNMFGGLQSIGTGLMAKDNNSTSLETLKKIYGV